MSVSILSPGSKYTIGCFPHPGRCHPPNSFAHKVSIRDTVRDLTKPIKVDEFMAALDTALEYAKDGAGLVQ